MPNIAVFEYAFYPNVGGAKIPYNSGIHPGGRSPRTKARKRANAAANHQARAAVNSARSSSTSNNPTWHGTGRHAGVRGSLAAGQVT